MECKHDIYYEGALDVMVKGNLSGVVDIWRCRKCGQVHADARFVGEPRLPESVGVGLLTELERWGLLICSSGDRVEWSVVPAGTAYEHSCKIYGECRISISVDGKVKCSEDHDHRFVFLKKYVNTKVVI